MDKGQEISVRERLHRSPVGARLALWFVISACGLVIVLQLMFAVIEVARPFIGPISDEPKAGRRAGTPPTGRCGAVPRQPVAATSGMRAAAGVSWLDVAPSRST